MESSLGRLSTTEMEMVSWIMAQWERQENPDDAWVHCSLKGLADAFGVRWSGSRAAFIKQGLERLHAVRFKAEVWNHKEGKLKTELFGIFDRVTIVERKDGLGALVGERWQCSGEDQDRRLPPSTVEARTVPPLFLASPARKAEESTREAPLHLPRRPARHGDACRVAVRGACGSRPVCLTRHPRPQHLSCADAASGCVRGVASS